MTNNCQILCIFCLQLTSSLRAAITSVRSVPQDVLFSAGFVLDLCLLQWVLKWNTSNQFLLSWNVYQLSACWIWIWYKDAFVCIVHGNTSGLMYLASWQEAFPVCGRILLLRLIYGCLGAVSCHLFRGKKKNKGLILHPKAKQASVRILRIYVNVQKSFQLRKQGDLPEQTVICYRKLFQQWICYM